MTVLVVALGGALGATARYGLSGWVQSLTRSGLPWGTAVVNVLGSFLLGFALAWFEARTSSSELRTFVAVGVLGAFTTFSTYSLETLTLIRERAWVTAAAYSLGSLALGLVAVVIGFGAAILMQGRG